MLTLFEIYTFEGTGMSLYACFFGYFKCVNVVCVCKRKDCVIIDLYTWTGSARGHAKPLSAILLSKLVDNRGQTTICMQ